jgi:hypothetical protein
VVAPRYLTVSEAAGRACVCDNVVRAWVAAGLLPALRLGMPGRRGKIMIDPDDLDQCLASFKTTATPPPPRPAGAGPRPAPRPSSPHLKRLSLD